MKKNFKVGTIIVIVISILFVTAIVVTNIKFEKLLSSEEYKNSGLVICKSNLGYCIRAGVEVDFSFSPEKGVSKSYIQQYYDLEYPWMTFDNSSCYYYDCFGSKLKVIRAYNRIMNYRSIPVPVVSNPKK